MGVSVSETHDEARSIASDQCSMETTCRPVFQQGEEDLSLSLSLSKQLTQSLAEPPIPDADGEHVEQLTTLEPAEEHDDTNDTE